MYRQDKNNTTHPKQPSNQKAHMRPTYNTQRPEPKKQTTKWGESLTRGHI
jgi:hypothetical protein